MSCDNIPENGHVAKRCVLSLANALDPTLGAWIEKNVPFPNTMVDRITPVTTPADIECLAEQYGISDSWPVVAEDFMQWVIEDNFVDGCRPPFEKVRLAAGAPWTTRAVPHGVSTPLPGWRCTARCTGSTTEVSDEWAFPSHAGG
jgi:hypothetical protein